MHMTKRIIEWAKTFLIALLTISAFLLGERTGLFNEFLRAMPLFNGVTGFVRSAGTGTGDFSRAHFTEAARPISIVITNSSGEKHGIKYDTLARNAAYDRTSSILAEALGSASEPQEISEDEWRSALIGSAVYFEYMTPIKLSVISAWLGARLPDAMEEASLRRIFVAIGEDRNSIYYQDCDSGIFYAAETASSAGKALESDIYSENGAQFAFETNLSAAENASYMLLLPGSSHPDIRAAFMGEIDEILDKVLETMGYSNEIYVTYDSGEAYVRVGSQFNIRADAQGRVTYRSTDIVSSNHDDNVHSEIELIELARAIVADTIGNYSNGAEVFFESLEYNPRNTVSAYFGYYMTGGRIHMFEEGFAAKILFADGNIMEMELNFRDFALTGEYTKLPPEKQSLAAAGEEFMLCYFDIGSESMQPAWAKHSMISSSNLTASPTNP